MIDRNNNIEENIKKYILGISLRNIFKEYFNSKQNTFFTRYLSTEDLFFSTQCIKLKKDYIPQENFLPKDFSTSIYVIDYKNLNPFPQLFDPNPNKPEQLEKLRQYLILIDNK